jgi:hypothetical protein
MKLLMGFAPFIVFALLSRHLPVTLALLAGALVACFQMVNDKFKLRQSIKYLEIGTAILFGSLAVFTYFSGGHWAITEVRMYVDAGLFLIVLLTMLFGRPFTMQYAREQVDARVAATPEFYRFNLQLSGVWALAFLALTIADFVMARMPEVPLWVGVAASLLALAGAAWFTTSAIQKRRSAVVTKFS